MGLPAAIVGSSVIGGLGSIFGARSANRAAERNQQAAQANIGTANTAIHQAMEPSWDRYRRGADANIAGLRSGQSAWHQAANPLEIQFGNALYSQSKNDPRYGGNTQFNRNTDFNRNTEIGGHWDDLRSQNFLQSPDYQFRKKEGLDAVQNSAAAGGAGLYSGNTLRGITDYASNLAAGEYGNWFGRQTGLADRDYGADVANYDRANQQFGQNYGRAADQFQGNFSRDYNVFSDNYGREEDRSRWLGGIGANALTAGANLDYGTETGIGQTNADYWGRQGQDITNAGYGYANNLTQGANIAANQPYVSPWGGINQAVQGGLQNYLWAQNAGMWNNPFSSGAQKPTAGQNIMYGPGGYRG